jgi:hypothetical protein
MVVLQTWLVVAALSAVSDVEVVEFTASTCGPCQAMEPVLESVAQRGIPVRRIDIDRRRDLADQYQVKSVPTLLIVSQGHVVDRIEGALPLEPLLARLQRFGTPQASPTPVEPPQGTNIASPPAASQQAVVQLAQQATVRLRVEDNNGHSFGTGTIIDVHGQDALVLTCGHIFRESQGKGRIVVDLFAAGQTSPLDGELIRFDLQRDLALVGIRTSAPIKAVPVAGVALHVAAGQQLFSLGCDHGGDPSVLPGRLKAINKYLGPENLTVDGRPVEGRSGGGLFSYDGYLVGVCNAADPEIEEGLYAAFASIHRHLDDAKLSFVYSGAPQAEAQLASQQLPVAPVADNSSAPGVPSPSAAWAHWDGPAAQPLPSHVAAQVQQEQSESAEVICIIRPHNHPAAQSQVVVLDRPSRDFLSQLSEERRAQSDRQMTQLRVSPSRTSSARPQPATISRPITVPRRLHRP